MTMKKIAKNIKFEEALAELEQQVQLLESGELPLEEALDRADELYLGAARRMFRMLKAGTGL